MKLIKEKKNLEELELTKWMHNKKINNLQFQEKNAPVKRISR